jgi:hypothetical protein
MKQEKGEAQMSMGRARFGHSTDEYEVSQIRKRQRERSGRVVDAHARNSMWCCSNEAEQCFNDLAALLQIMDGMKS